MGRGPLCVVSWQVREVQVRILDLWKGFAHLASQLIRPMSADRLQPEVRRVGEGAATDRGGAVLHNQLATPGSPSPYAGSPDGPRAPRNPGDQVDSCRPPSTKGTSVGGGAATDIGMGPLCVVNGLFRAAQDRTLGLWKSVAHLANQFVRLISADRLQPKVHRVRDGEGG